MNQKERFHDLLSRGIVLLDGAMGTMLQAKGIAPGTVPEVLNLTHPQWLLEIHEAYLAAGADLLYANTFGASELKSRGCGYPPEELIAAGIALAKRAARARRPDALVALDLGPT